MRARKAGQGSTEKPGAPLAQSSHEALLNYIPDREVSDQRGRSRGASGTALLLALAGFASFTMGDALVKSMSGDWPAPAIGALRYSIGALALAAILGVRHGRAAFTVPQPWLQLGRGAAVSVATICFFIAVMQMPLADATAVQFTSPLLTALLAAVFLRERPPLAVWTAIGVASVGVLLVLRPNLAAVGTTAFLPLGTALGMAILIMLNRKTAGSAPALVMQFLFQAMAAPLLIGAAIIFAIISPAQFAIPFPDSSVLLKCTGIAVTGTVGHLLIYSATERASASTIAPMTYVQLLAAGLLGWIWFGDAPDRAAVVGAALIVGAGLLVWHEGRLSRGRIENRRASHSVEESVSRGGLNERGDRSDAQ